MTQRRDGIAIFGAGGHGRVVADIAERCGYNTVVFLDSRWPGRETNLHWNVIGTDFAAAPAGFDRFVAIGGNQARLAMLGAPGAEWPVLIDPSATVSRHALLGAGTVAMAGVVINAGARLGRGVIANSGCTIDHDCVLGDGVHVSPGAHLAGGVSVGAASWIGIGACVRETIKIGEGAMVAAGAAVIADVPSGAKVMGVPARMQKA
jgi:sugar O-acyltransferase (sialic acid O-acetyltransferase NeuD family)